MKKTTCTIIGIISLCLDVQASISPKAQKRLSVIESDFESLNYKVGNLYYTPSFKSKIGYDSNPTTSTSSDKDNGYYIENGLGIDLYNQPFQALTLDTSFLIGYREGFGNNSEGGLTLGSDQGNATIGFDYELNEKLTLSVVNDASINFEKLDDYRDNQDGEARQFWSNDIGAQIHREITHDTGIALKVGLNTRRDLKNNYLNEEYDETYLGVTIDHIVNSNLTVNPFFNYSERDWLKDEANNDVDSTEIGLSIDYLFNDRLSANLVIAYQERDFADTAILKSKSSSTHHGLVGSFIITHLASEKFTHSIRGSFDNEPTTVEISNISEETHLGYQALYTVNEKLSLSAGFDWLHGEDKGKTNGGYEETYDIYMPSIGARYQFTQRQTLEFKCEYQNKTARNDSSVIANEYERTNVFLEYTYTF